MIIGNLQNLSLAGLPAALRAILERDECRLAALQQREDGRFQPADAPWFCRLLIIMTPP